MSYRILTIDGGGVKGVFPASFLATVEDSIGAPIANYFDLIVGTSTGGIIAIGLGLGLPACEILDLYERHANDIFPSLGAARFVSWLWTPKYRPGPLRNALESKIGQRRLGESRARLVIPSVNLENGQVYIYKTAHHLRFERDYRENAVDVALATAAAPSYFPSHVSTSGTALVDGGVWANNPIGMAVVEAIGVLEWPRDQIDILSLGCTTTPLHPGRGPGRWMGIAYWAPRILDLMFAAQSSASLGTAYTLVGHDHVYRVSPYVAPGRFSLDGPRDIPALRGLGDSEARNALPNLRARFLTTEAEPFVPFHRVAG